MQTLHIASSDSAREKILTLIENLAKEGEEVELLDERLYRYEKRGIDLALEDEKCGRIFSKDELLKELLDDR